MNENKSPGLPGQEIFVFRCWRFLRTLCWAAACGTSALLTNLKPSPQSISRARIRLFAVYSLTAFIRLHTVLGRRQLLLRTLVPRYNLKQLITRPTAPAMFTVKTVTRNVLGRLICYMRSVYASPILEDKIKPHL
jgi:hypothetical protein